MAQIALIIPFFNGSQYLEEAIISSKNQTLPFHEIIIVDDGSKESESIIARSLAEKHQIDFICKKNGGQGCARNAGGRIAKSNYLCFLDQDDILLPQHNQILLEEIVKQPKHMRGAIYANFLTAQANGLIISRHSRPARDIDIESKNIYSFLRQDMFILPSATIIYKNAFLDIGGFDEQFRGYEDDDLFIRLFRKGYNISYINKEVYIWRMHKNQTSSSKIMCSSRLKFINKWYNHQYDSTIDISILRKSIFKRFVNTIYTDIKNASTIEDYLLAREIAKAFHAIYKSNYKITQRIKHVIKCNKLYFSKRKKNTSNFSD